MRNALGDRFHAHLLQFRGNLARRVIKLQSRQGVSKIGNRDHHQYAANTQARHQFDQREATVISRVPEDSQPAFHTQISLRVSPVNHWFLWEPNELLACQASAIAL